MKTPKFTIFVACIICTAFLLVTQSDNLQSADPVSEFMQEYALPDEPLNITVDSTGRVWFTLPQTNAIGSLVITETATVKMYPVPTASSQPYDLAYADGVIWFTERIGNKIGRLDVADGTFQEFPIPTANSEPTGIAVASDGQVWFTERTGNKIGRFDPSTSHFDEYSYDTPNAQFEDIALVDEHRVWATAPNLDQVVYLELSGATFTFFSESTRPYLRPTGVVIAGGQQLWVTASASDQILRYAPGSLTLWVPYALPIGNSGPTMLAHRDLGATWEFWFTEHTTGKIGRLLVRPNGERIELRNQRLPTDESRPWGVVVDADGHVWVAGRGSNGISEWRPPYFEPSQGPSATFLPLILRDKCSRAKPATPFGVQLYGATGRANRFHSFLVESGAHWIRAELPWVSVEPHNVNPAQYTWSGADMVVGAATEGCFNLVLTILNNPFWAATRHDGPIDKVELDEFADFIGAVVERYDGDGQADAPGSPAVNHFEFYNEPDAGSYSAYGRWGHFGQDYAAMLAAIYPVVKAANPQAQVVLGGLAYDGFIEHDGYFVRTFLDDVLTAGGGAYFDYMNFHYYPAFASAWTQGKGPGLKEKVEAVRNKLNDYGVDRPILITETGWPNNLLDSTDEIQSRYVVELFTQSLAAQVEVTFSWTLADLDPPWSMGLVTHADPPVKKPAFAVYQIMVEELTQAQFEPTLPQPETDNADVEVYSFRDRTYGQTLYITWLDPVNAADTADLHIPATKVSVRELYGPLHTVHDEDDQEQDGKVTVAVGASPVYIRVLE